MGALRFYDFNETKDEFVVNNYMQGFWANPHSKNSIILLGNKLICAYKGITIIDVNKRLITKINSMAKSSSEQPTALRITMSAVIYLMFSIFAELL